MCSGSLLLEVGCHSLKNFRARASCSKILNDKKCIFSTVKNSRATLFFKASASCSKILNDKKYIFNTVTNSRGTLFFRASVSCSKILNDKRYIFSTVNSGHPLFFRASASCSKILNDKKHIFNAVKYSRATWFFQGKRKLFKNSEYKTYIPFSENFQGNSVFQGKR